MKDKPGGHALPEQDLERVLLERRDDAVTKSRREACLKMAIAWWPNNSGRLSVWEKRDLFDLADDIAAYVATGLKPGIPEED
jgi:hypothetical protein